MWLAGMQQPDFRTLNDFRGVHAAGEEKRFDFLIPYGNYLREKNRRYQKDIRQASNGRMKSRMIAYKNNMTKKLDGKHYVFRPTFILGTFWTAPFWRCPACCLVPDAPGDSQAVQLTPCCIKCWSIIFIPDSSGKSNYFVKCDFRHSSVRGGIPTMGVKH